MNRNVFKKLSHYGGITYGSAVPCDDSSYVYNDSELQRVLNEIFSVDERTGFPRGDIAYFLSKDGNPQVKAWLESNLLSPRVKKSGSSIEGVTDDFIAEYARNLFSNSLR